MPGSFTSNAEWAYMYRRGLSRAQISELCNVPLERVTRSISKLRKNDPSLEVQHSRLRPSEADGGSATLSLTPRWSARLNNLRDFQEAHGRLPSQVAADPWEQPLRRWDYVQRAALKRGMLSPARSEALDESGCRLIPMRAQADDVHWQTSWTDWSTSLSDLERLPSRPSDNDREERRLGTRAACATAERVRRPNATRPQRPTGRSRFRLEHVDPAKRNRNPSTSVHPTRVMTVDSRPAFRGRAPGTLVLVP